MEIGISNLFPNPVINAELKDVDNDALVKFAYQLRAADEEGAGKPLEDGWQSKNVPVQSHAMYEALMQRITAVMGECCKQLSIPKLILTKSWININPPKTYIDAHEHAGSVFSGVYYVSVPEGSGDISFMRGDVAQYFLPRGGLSSSSFLANKASVPSKPHLLLLFPSWLSHKVSMNNSSEDRISVSFNFAFPV